MQFQMDRYQIEIDPVFKAFLRGLQEISEDRLYDYSYRIEPRKRVGSNKQY